MAEERYIQNLAQAQKSLQIADHMTYITYPLVKEKRLLLKVLSELSAAILSSINAILQYEYYWKRIQIYNDARANFETFKRISKRYDLGEEQVRKLIEILELAERHKKSSFEFVKNEKIVIMSDNLAPSYVTLEKVKEFLIYAKDFLKKVNMTVNKSHQKI